MRRRIAYVVCALGLGMLLPARALAADIVLAWDPSSGPDAVGYIVEYGTSVSPFATAVDVGSQTTWTFTGAVAGQTYSFRVRAYNSARVASDPSAPVTATVPGNVAPTITSQPANATIVAAASASFTVAASGSPVPTYRWQVSTNGGVSFANLSNVAPYGGTATATLTVTAAPAQMNGYRYRCVATNVAGTATSNAATLKVTPPPPTFTDNPLIARATFVKAVHITELRTAINQLRAAHGLTAFAWTDPTLIVGTTPMKAVHLNELRTALAAAYVAAARTAPTYASGAITGRVTVITVAQIAELRAAVLALW